MPLATVDPRAPVISAIGIEQLAQQRPTNLVHTAAHGHLQGFEVHRARTTTVAKGLRDESVDLPCDLVFDDLRQSFF